MHFAIAIAQMNVNRFSLKLLDFVRAGIGQNQMTDIDISADSRMTALVNEANHSVHTVEKAEAERLQFEDNIDFLFGGIIAEATAAFDSPLQ